MRSFLLRGALVAVLVAAGLWTSTPVAVGVGGAEGWTLEWLPVPADTRDAWASAVSDQGEITGHIQVIHSAEYGSRARAALWQDGRHLDIGDGWGPDTLGTHGVDVNDAGEVLVLVTSRPPTVAERTYLRPPAGPPLAYPEGARPQALSDTGIAVGWAPGERCTAAAWWGRERTTTMLPDLGRCGSGARAVAGDYIGGLAVGDTVRDADSNHAVRWHGGRIFDFGSTDGCGSDVFGINRFGDMAGYADLPGQCQRFNEAALWRDGTRTLLGKLPGAFHSEARAVNDAGQVVGFSTFGDESTRAVLWWNGRMTALDEVAPLGPGSLAVDINNQGQIVGVAWRNPWYRPFLLTPPSPPPVDREPPPPPPPPTRSGYWMIGRTVDVYAFGDARWFGNVDEPPGTEVVDIEGTPSGNGYWTVTNAGHVHAFGDARPFSGTPALRAGESVTTISRTPDGGGYWLFTTLGRAVAFGNAQHRGDMAATPLNGPVLESASTPHGSGYWMVASDGGVFTFGDARFFGSMGSVRLNAPVMSLVPDRDRVGYWLVASDGGVFSFEAVFRGSMGGVRLNQPVVGGVAYGDGYLLVASDGGIFNFSSKPFRGSLGANPPAQPIVAVAAMPG